MSGRPFAGNSPESVRTQVILDHSPLSRTWAPPGSASRRGPSLQTRLPANREPDRLGASQDGRLGGARPTRAPSEREHRVPAPRRRPRSRSSCRRSAALGCILFPDNDGAAPPRHPQSPAASACRAAFTRRSRPVDRPATTPASADPPASVPETPDSRRVRSTRTHPSRRLPRNAPVPRPVAVGKPAERTAEMCLTLLQS